jgi:peptidoglycan/LPS O-acetylase OafA/YrhL
VAGNRIHYVDWLRLLAVLAVLVFHALLPFGSFLPWVVRNESQSESLALLTALLPFAFPVFFLLAGVSARYALETRSVRGFLAERATRLLVPFATGTLVLTPLTAYVIALHDDAATGPFSAFLAAYPGVVFDDVASNVGLAPLALQVIGMHLWFLAWLFLFSVLGSPLFGYLSGARGRSIVDRLARGVRWPGSTLLFTAPLIVIALPLFGISSPRGWDWAVFGLWGGTFAAGFVMVSDERLVAAVRRDLLPALVAAVVGIGGLAATGFTDSIFRGGAHTYDATYLLVVGFHGLSVWGVTLTIISAAMRVRFLQWPLPARVNEMVLPIYLLHYPIVIALSALVVQWPFDLWPKAALNVSLGLAATIVVVTLVTRIPVVRPLLGLRRQPGRLVADAVPSSAVVAR